MERLVEFSTFGPPSKRIRIAEFVTAAKESQQRVSSVLAALSGNAMQLDNDDGDLEADFEPIPNDLRPTIEAECRWAPYSSSFSPNLLVI